MQQERARENINKFMRKKIIISVIIIAILAGAAIWYFSRGGNEKQNPLAVSENEPVLIAQADYICNGGKTIKASFYKGEQITVEPGQPPVPTGSVKLILNDGTNLDLPQTISADGGRYANDDESFIFWSKGDGAIVLEDGAEQNYVGCAVQK